MMTEIFQDIREIYDFAAPCGELLPYIEFFSESSAEKCALRFDQGHASVTMFGSWTPTFYINLAGAYVIDVAGNRSAVSKDQDILVLRNGTVTRHNGPEDRIFTVKFYPGGLDAVLGLNQSAMQDRVIRLQDILPLELLGAMKAAANFSNRIEIMENYLLGMMRRSSGDHYSALVRQAIGEYSASGMRLNTSEVAERLFITSKSINRYFNRVVGVAPKQYFSLLRARTALTAMMADKPGFQPWDFGYYDPAHFYKDVHNFTGRRLSEIF
ncbi:helix-turn-helix domain-containing protein [Mucilaginibacter sp. CAU 1740]|uniref:helix-turn-helix domain-containing protein n=1 Tax=Mucilaginibacter sp. CAU 1740 TaxID=3140365 RepID=UPI00325B43A2